MRGQVHDLTKETKNCHVEEFDDHLAAERRFGGEEEAAHAAAAELALTAVGVADGTLQASLKVAQTT